MAAIRRIQKKGGCGSEHIPAAAEMYEQNQYSTEQPFAAAASEKIPAAAGIVSIVSGALGLFMPMGGLCAIAGLICGICGLVTGIRRSRAAGVRPSRAAVVLPSVGIGMCALTVAAACVAVVQLFSSLG